MLGLLFVIFECCFEYENWSALTGITPSLNCSKYQCVVPKKSCIIVMISKNPSK